MKTVKIVLHFPRTRINQPIVCRMVKEFNLSFNILKAKILPDEEGVMIMELSGEPGDYERGIQYLKDSGVSIEPLSRDVMRDEDKCTHCGACVVICPAQALRVEGDERKIVFEAEKCIACELCISACPTRAMVLQY